MASERVFRLEVLLFWPGATSPGDAGVEAEWSVSRLSSLAGFDLVTDAQQELAARILSNKRLLNYVANGRETEAWLFKVDGLEKTLIQHYRRET